MLCENDDCSTDDQEAELMPDITDKIFKEQTVLNHFRIYQNELTAF